MNPLTTQQLTNLNSSELLHKLDELKNAAFALGHEMAEAEKAFKDVKEMMPSYLAEQQIYCQGEDMTLSEAKVYALSHPIYTEKILEMNELGKTYRLKEVEFRGIMKSLDCLQAIAFVRNNELKLAR